MAQYLPLPDGSYLTLQEGETPSDALERAHRDAPEAFLPPEKPAGRLESFGAGVASGLGDLPLGMAHAAAKGLGVEDTGLQDTRKALSEWGTKHGTGTFTGKVGSVIGGLAPFVVAAPFTGGMSLAGELGLNALTMGIPGAVDAYENAKKEGADDTEAYEKAALAAGMGTIAPKIVSGGSRAVGKALKAGEGSLSQAGLAAGEGAAFSATHMAANKAIEAANNRQTEAPWFSLEDTAASALGFGVLRGAHKAMTPKPPVAPKPPPIVEAPPPPPPPSVEDKLALGQRYDEAMQQRDELIAQADTFKGSKDPADMLLHKQAKEAVRDHVQTVLNPLAEQYAPFKAEVAALRAKPAEAAPEVTGTALPDGPQLPSNPYIVQQMYDKAMQGHMTAVQQAAEAARSGDLKAAQAAEAESQRQVALVRALQPHLPAPEAPAPRVAPIAEIQQRLTQLQGGTTAKGKPVEGLYAKALRIGDYEKATAHREEMSALQQKLAEAQRGVEQQQAQGAALEQQAQVPGLQEAQAEINQQREQLGIARTQEARGRQEQATGEEIAGMGAGRMPTGRTDQMGLTGETESSYPRAPSLISLQDQISRLPENLHPEQQALVSRVQDNLTALAAQPEQAQRAADWLHRLSLGAQTQIEGNADTAATGYRERDMHGMLTGIEAGKTSESQQVLEPTHRMLTEEQQTALKGTQGYRNRTTTTEMAPTGEVQTAQQRDMFPQEHVQGKLFPSMKAFQNFMGGDVLHKLRLFAGNSIQTLSRALRMSAPIGRRISQMEENAVREQEGYARAIATGDRGAAAAEAAHAAAKDRLKALSEKLDLELRPLQVQWMEARNSLKGAAEHSFDVADRLYQNSERFGAVQGDAKEALLALVNAKERLSNAVSAPVSKPGWDEMRAAQQAIAPAASFLESHRAALPAEVMRFLEADRFWNAKLEQAILTEGRLREIHDSAREALDRLAKNQHRRKSVKEEQSAATAEALYREMMREAAAKAARSARLDAGKAAAKAETDVRNAKAERSAIMDPVMAAQAKRTERTATEATHGEGEEQASARRRAEQASEERKAALPGREVDSQERRGWMNDLADAESRAHKYDMQLERAKLVGNEDLVASATTQRNDARREAEVLHSKLEQTGTQLKALQPKLDKKAEQVRHLESAEEGGIDEPGISSALRASRVKELGKARKTLANMKQAANKVSGIKVKEKGETVVEREEPNIEDYVIETEGKLLAAQHAGNDRLIRLYENDLKLLEAGKLPPRKVGPLVKPVVLAGETRTGTDASKKGAIKTGSRSKITQSGMPRAVTTKQAEREGNEAALEREAKQGLDEEALRLKEEAAKDREAVAAAKAAPKMTAKEQQALQAELDAEMNREDRRAASVPDDGRTTTALSEKGVGLAEDGQIVKLAEHIAKTGLTEETRAQATILSKLLMRTKLIVQDEVTHEGKKVSALYDPEVNTIYLDRKALSEEDFIHEAYHAATDSVLLADKSTLTPKQLQARKELEAMHEVLRKHPAFKGVHAAASVREFVAEIKTNDALRAKLKAVGKPTTLWQRIVSAIKHLLKMDDVSKANKLIEDILQSSRRVTNTTSTPSIFRSTASTLPASLTNFNKHTTDARTTLDKAKELKGVAGLAMRQAVADVRASLREALTYGKKDQGDAISALVTQRDSVINNAQAVADFGAYGTAKDAKGNLIISAGHSASLRDTIEAARDLPGADADEKLKLFHSYRVAKRAEQVGWDKFDFKNEAEAAADGRALLATIAADPKLKAALAAVDKPYNDLNRGMIQFVADAHALPKEATDAMLADKNYIPFYRVNGDTISVLLPNGHPQSIGDIRTQPYLHALVGGDQALMGFTDATLRNISTLTSLALDNMTSKQVAYHLQDIAKGTGKMAIKRYTGTEKGQDIVRFRQTPDPKIPKDDGQRYIRIDTEGTALEGIPTALLAQSIAGTYSTLPGFTKVAAVASDLLRSGVTRNPFYIIRQLLKDSSHASLTGNVEALPIMAVAKSVRNFISIMRGQSAEMDTLRKHGVSHSNIFSGTSSDHNKVARMLAGDQQGWTNRVLAFMDKAAMAADAATRTQVYQDIVAKGGTEMEAVNAARELMNFNRHGSASSVQFFSSVIPFFNAAIQGLDVMYRSATGKMPAAERMNTKQKFFNRAMGMSAMAMAYAVLMEDDPEWASLPLHKKMANIVIPNGFSEDGESLKLPVPFETGMAFFSMPVALVQAMRKDFTATDWKAVRTVLIAQMPGGGSLMPQVAKGAYDVSRNYNSGLNAPIESAKVAKLDPTQRFTAKTTEAAKAFSEAVNAAGIPLSPIQIEYLSNAYFGQLPLMVAESVNSLFEDADKVKPAGHLSESKVWGWLFQGEFGTDASEHAYEKATKAEMVNNTFKDKLAKGDREGAKLYREEHKAEFASAAAAGAFTKRMGLLNTEMDRVRNAPKGSNMTAEEKQARIDKLKKAQQEVASRFLEVFQRIEDRAESTAS